MFLYDAVKNTADASLDKENPVPIEPQPSLTIDDPHESEETRGMMRAYEAIENLEKTDVAELRRCLPTLFPNQARGFSPANPPSRPRPAASSTPRLRSSWSPPCS
jgi:hypothetical protein